MGCYLLDPSGSIKLTAWEHRIHELTEGKTYRFENLRVTKEFNTDTLALGTSVQDCTITECEKFQAPLPNPTARFLHRRTDHLRNSWNFQL